MMRYEYMLIEYGFVDVLLSFVGFVGIMPILHVLHVCASFFFFFCIVLCFVLCCAYHVHDKMSLRCFCVLL